MRSIFPIAGNPWPHDMIISVDGNPYQVMELLWVREALSLHPAGDLPPLLVDTPPRSGEADDVDAWEDAWAELWNAVVHHAAGVIGPSHFEEIRDTADGSPERAELLLQLRGPTWRDRFGDMAFDESYKPWSKRSYERSRKWPHSLGQSPERISLNALISAWEAGLSKIITIPCHGEYIRVIRGSTLLMTEATRDTPERYTAALRTFPTS
ncbi:MAG: hypothetical protein ACYCZK_01930 [Microbacteriaceae bacterium]